MSVQYVPVARLTMYSHGVTPGPDFPGVPNTYFPLRHGGRVTLYQDAHVPDDGQCLSEIRLRNGELYLHGSKTACRRRRSSSTSPAGRCSTRSTWCATATRRGH
ncbi:hypothetical protein ZWY2020_036681 [Hordeum vulgare]|nr:hypothetical protein ZWY2020_036681 [Hordeum vulgare]